MLLERGDLAHQSNRRQVHVFHYFFAGIRGGKKLGLMSGHRWPRGVILIARAGQDSLSPGCLPNTGDRSAWCCCNVDELSEGPSEGATCVRDVSLFLWQMCVVCVGTVMHCVVVCGDSVCGGSVCCVCDE